MEPSPFLIPSWLLAHRRWQLLVGAECPHGSGCLPRRWCQGEGGGTASRPPPPLRHFPAWDPSIPPHTAAMLQLGYAVRQTGIRNTLGKGVWVRKPSNALFVLAPSGEGAPSIPSPSLGSPVWDICVPGCPVWDHFQCHRGPGSLAAAVTLPGGDKPSRVPQLKPPKPSRGWIL